jgi:Ca-activated chloride channel family protein
MNFLQPLFLLSLLAVLALIAIYLWHPRRLRQTVSQVFLFLRARRELLTRFTRWRFLRSLILLLQVLTLVFLGLAAALPQSDLYPLSGNRCAIVVDVSLSMMAQDVSPDRFHVALEKTRQLARELLQGNNLVSVWTLGKNPTLVIDYSNKLGALDRAIQSIKPEFSAPTNIDDLLALLS